MFKRIKKHIFRIGIILGILIFIGGMILNFNSVGSLIKYKNVKLKAERDDEKLVFRQGYAYKRKNVPVQVSLSGTHYEMGVQYGVLLKDEIKYMVNSLYKLISFYSKQLKIPKDIVYIYFKFKINRLAKNYPERFKKEIQGISDGSGVNINAIYALSLFDDAVHSMGCTSVLAISQDGSIIHGRNEDLFFGMELGMRSVIIKYNPKGYNSYESVSFPGFIGVSTGFNDKGLGYSHHSRFANSVDLSGYPQHCISRMALEECSSLKDVENFYKNKHVAIGDAHTWSDRNNKTGCIIETAPNKKDPVKITEMNGNAQWHINKYIDPKYIKQDENKYTGDESFNNSRQEILNNLIKSNEKMSLDDVISILRDENGPDGENYNLSSITRGICNIDTQQMIVFDPMGKGLYIARNYYYASKSTVYFVPWDFDESPYVYKKSETIQPVLQDTAKVKESLLSQDQIIKRLKELTVKYPNEGYIYFMIGQAYFESGKLNDWTKYIEKAYELSSFCDKQDVTLERAKAAFYQRDMELTGKLLKDISCDGLRSFKAKAQFLYLYKMYYEKVNNKAESQKYENKFLSLVSDKKTQGKIVKSLKAIKN